VKRAGKSIDANIQFKRICTNLGIEIKTTSVPQAKGRVERYNAVFQDRLAANELRFSNIKTIEKANKYLNDVYIPKHNNKFALIKNQEQTVFSKLNFNLNELNLMLGLEYERKVLNGNVISINNIFYKAYNDDGSEIKFWHSEKVIVIFAYNGQMYLKRPLNNQTHSLKVFKKNSKNPKSHPVAIGHRWKQNDNYGKPIREQVW